MATPPIPNHKQEHTGNPVLDRIQQSLRNVIHALATLMVSFETTRVVSLALAKPFITTSGTLAPTPLTFKVKAGEIWVVEYCGLETCSSTNGMGFGIAAPANSTVTGTLWSSAGNTAVANWVLSTFFAVNTFISALHVGAPSTGSRPTTINARVRVVADGFITIMVQSVTAGTTTTIATDTFLKATKVSLV